MTRLAASTAALLLLTGAAAQRPSAADREEAALGPDAAWYRAVEASLAADVRAMQTIDAAARAPMLEILSRPDDLDDGRVYSSKLAVAFRTWLPAARRLPPATRTKALLLADRLMDHLGHRVAIDARIEPDGTFRIAGAEFSVLPLGGFAYHHTFLREAERTAPPGPARDAVILRQMEIGFDYEGACSGGEDVWKKVIDDGESLLRRSNDAKVRAAAHLMVADAYATIVALASGAVPADYVDPSVYTAREPEARRKAIAHYRAGLAVRPPPPPDAELVQRDLKLLLEGRVPRFGSGRFYYCVYD